MTYEEFSQQFDFWYDNLMSNASPGLNEYEKSLLLTRAQEEIVKNYVNPLGNKYRSGVDDTSKRQVDLAPLIVTTTLVSPYKFPKDVISVLNEYIEFADGKIKQVIPLSYDEYTRRTLKPYKEPLRNEAWRLIKNTTIGDTEIQLIVSTPDKDKDFEYFIRYIKKPKPIITYDLTDFDVTIEGFSSPMTSELNPEIHSEIVQRAVEIAKASYASDQNGTAQLQNQITIGQRSE